MTSTRPVLVMRDTTEHPEAVSAGTARLVGTDPTACTPRSTSCSPARGPIRRWPMLSTPTGDGCDQRWWSSSRLTASEAVSCQVS
jgi:UDP-N-acetylglucosamine 2-epimerase (non-hydrolysing)